MKESLPRKLLLIAFGGILAVLAAYVVGPRGSLTTMNLFDGEAWTDHDLLWHSWRLQHPVEPHTEWARANTVSKQSYWPVFVCSSRSDWFGGTIVGDGFARDVVRELYELPLSEPERVEMLHAFHRDLSALAAPDEKAPLLTLYETWDERLQTAP